MHKTILGILVSLYIFPTFSMETDTTLSLTEQLLTAVNAKDVQAVERFVEQRKSEGLKNMHSPEFAALKSIIQNEQIEMLEIVMKVFDNTTQFEALKVSLAIEQLQKKRSSH